MGLFSSILGAVAGPVLGLFKKDKPQVTQNRVDYKQMVKDAQAAGFNPLTVLRNGGSAGFSTQVHHPALSSGGWADALATGINAFASYDPMAEQREMLEYNIVQEQLKQLQRGNANAARRNSFNVPSFSGVSGMRSAGGFVAPSRSAAVGTGSTAGKDVWAGTVFEPFLSSHPNYPPAQVAEDELGEPISWAYGVGKLGADLAWRQSKRPNIAKAYAEGMDAYEQAARKYASTAPVRDRGSNAFAQGLMVRKPKPFYPDYEDFRRGQGPAW